MAARGFWYLASPYRHFPGGLEAAAQLAANEAGRLLVVGWSVFSPIAHFHPQGPVVERLALMAPTDSGFWVAANEPFIGAAIGMLELRASSWEISEGMRLEREAFTRRSRPVIAIYPGDIPAPYSGLDAFGREWPR